MAARSSSDSIHNVAGFLARHLPEVEVIGPDVLMVLLEAEPRSNCGTLAIPSASVEIADLLATANAILEMPLPSERLLSRQTRERRVRVYFRYLLAARRRLQADRERASELCTKAGRWFDYLRTRYWCFLVGCQLYSLAAAGLRYRLFGTPNARVALALRRRSRRIVSIRSGATAL